MYVCMYVYIYIYIYIYASTNSTGMQAKRLSQKMPPARCYRTIHVCVYIYIYIYIRTCMYVCRSLGVVSDKIASAKRNPVQTGNTTTTPPTTTTTTTSNNNKGR